MTTFNLNRGAAKGTYKTLAEFIASDRSKVGDKVETLGELAVNDGEGRDYLVLSTNDTGSFELPAVGLWAIELMTAGSSSGVEEAPEDGVQYARKDAAWEQVADSGISEAPVDGKPYSRQDAGWVPSATSGEDGFSPYISDGTDTFVSGNWIDEDGDTGIAAKGAQGIQGQTGQKGEDGDSFTVDYTVATYADLSTHDAEPEGTSVLVSADESVDGGSYIYFKQSNTSGDWSIPAPFGKGEQGFSPYISDGTDGNATGNWIDEVGDTGVAAKGAAGAKGDKGADGDQGPRGLDGTDAGWEVVAALPDPADYAEGYVILLEV